MFLKTSTKPEIHNMLAISTIHLSAETYKRLRQDEFPGVAAYHKDATAGGYEFGVFVAILTDWQDCAESDLTECMRYAAQNGCDWIMFDPDAPQYACLPNYSHEW